MARFNDIIKEECAALVEKKSTKKTKKPWPPKPSPEEAQKKKDYDIDYNPKPTGFNIPEGAMKEYSDEDKKAMDKYTKPIPPQQMPKPPVKKEGRQSPPKAHVSTANSVTSDQAQNSGPTGRSFDNSKLRRHSARDVSPSEPNAERNKASIMNPRRRRDNIPNQDGKWKGEGVVNELELSTMRNAADKRYDQAQAAQKLGNIEQSKRNVGHPVESKLTESFKNVVKNEFRQMLKEAEEKAPDVQSKLETLRKKLVKEGQFQLGSGKNDRAARPERRIPVATVSELITVPINELVLFFLNGERITEDSSADKASLNFRMGNGMVYFYNPAEAGE